MIVCSTVVEFAVKEKGRVGLDASPSVSPRIIAGSERGKEPNESLGASGGSDNSIGPGLVVILNGLNMKSSSSLW